jgi:hypothetical protein
MFLFLEAQSAKPKTELGVATVTVRRLLHHGEMLYHDELIDRAEIDDDTVKSEAVRVSLMEGCKRLVEEGDASFVHN